MAAPYLQTCTKCKIGIYRVWATRVLKRINKRVRILRCNHCNHAPDEDTIVIPLEQSPARPPRKSRRIY